MIPLTVGGYGNRKMSGKSQVVLRWMISGNPVFGSEMVKQS